MPSPPANPHSAVVKFGADAASHVLVRRSRSSDPRHQRARQIVGRYTLFSVGSSFIPVWWLNSSAITSLQLKMLADVSQLYDVDFAQDLVGPILGSLAGGALSLIISQHPISQALKRWILTVPVIGLPLRITTGPAIMAAYTYSLGMAFVHHYESGGTYLDFEARKIREQLREVLGFAS